MDVGHWRRLRESNPVCDEAPISDFTYSLRVAGIRKRPQNLVQLVRGRKMAVRKVAMLANDVVERSRQSVGDCVGVIGQIACELDGSVWHALYSFERAAWRAVDLQDLSMVIAMNIEQRVRRSLALRKDDVFLRKEFDKFGSQSQVTRTLRKLVADGVLVKLGVGIYAKAKKSVLSGRPIPVCPVDVLASSILKKLCIDVGPSRLTAAYNSGESTQIPAGTVLNVGESRISRKIGFGGRYVRFEKNSAD